MALALRRRQYDHVVHIDTDSQPRILHYGEDFLLEDLPLEHESFIRSHRLWVCRIPELRSAMLCIILSKQNRFMLSFIQA